MADEIHPTPEPLEVNDVLVIAIGTALWLVALIVVVVGFRDSLDRHGQSWVIWACVAGVVLGLAGVAYCARRKRRLARRATAVATAGQSVNGSPTPR